jgi:hypothetical protein
VFVSRTVCILTVGQLQNSLTLPAQPHFFLLLLLYLFVHFYIIFLFSISFFILLYSCFLFSFSVLFISQFNVSPFNSYCYLFVFCPSTIALLTSQFCSCRDFSHLFFFIYVYFIFSLLHLLYTCAHFFASSSILSMYSSYALFSFFFILTFFSAKSSANSR